MQELRDTSEGEPVNETETLDCILRWFGYRTFKIQDFSDDRIDELLAGIPTKATTQIGKRSRVGKELSRLHGRQFYLDPNRNVRFDVVRWADQSIPGIYQIAEQ